MEEIKNNIKISRKGPSIPEISEALTSLFKWESIKSEKMKKSIKEIYGLIDSICNKLPEDLRVQLLRWPVDASRIDQFTNKMKERFSDYWDNAMNIIEDYKRFFQRGWDWCIKEWREIVSRYNPNRISKMIN